MTPAPPPGRALGALVCALLLARAAPRRPPPPLRRRRALAASSSAAPLAGDDVLVVYAPAGGPVGTASKSGKGAAEGGSGKSAKEGDATTAKSGKSESGKSAAASKSGKSAAAVAVAAPTAVPTAAPTAGPTVDFGDKARVRTTVPAALCLADFDGASPASVAALRATLQRVAEGGLAEDADQRVTAVIIEDVRYPPVAVVGGGSKSAKGAEGTTSSKSGKGAAAAPSTAVPTAAPAAADVDARRQLRPRRPPPRRTLEGGLFAASAGRGVAPPRCADETRKRQCARGDGRCRWDAATGGCVEVRAPRRSRREATVRTTATLAAASLSLQLQCECR